MKRLAHLDTEGDDLERARRWRDEHTLGERLEECIRWSAVLLADEIERLGMDEVRRRIEARDPVDLTAVWRSRAQAKRR